MRSAVGILVLLAVAAHCQVSEVPYRQLTWDDFRIDDTVEFEYTAKTSWGMRSRYTYNTSKHNGGYRTTLTSYTLYSYFNPEKSFRRSRQLKDPEGLLRHEQGHLDLAEIGVRTTMSLPESVYPLVWAPTREAAKREFVQKMVDFTESRRNEVRALQTMYDEATDHFNNKQMQKKWNEYIDAKLKTPQAQLPLPRE